MFGEGAFKHFLFVEGTYLHFQNLIKTQVKMQKLRKPTQNVPPNSAISSIMNTE